MSNILIEPDKLDRLRTLVIRSRRRVVGTLAGVHQSPHFGASVEFREHKEYSPGDDLRMLDWKIYGRTDKYYVKRFERETNVHAYLLIDASASMDYGTVGHTKFQQAVSVASSLAFLLLSQGDSVGISLFSSTLRQVVPPKSRSGHLKVLYSLLDEARPSGETNVTGALQDLLPRVRAHSMLFLLSDFLDLDPKDLDRSIAMIRQVRGDAVVFHVVDPSEEEFPFHERTEFVGLERPLHVLTYPQTIRQRYQALFREFAGRVRHACLAGGVEYERLGTRDAIDAFLLQYVERRMDLARPGRRT